MSFIKNIEQEDRNIRKHGDAKTTYTTANIDDKIYFQITTFGSSERQDVGAASQMIQFDEKSAKELYELFKKTYSFD
jgi:hypothetical protein